MSKVFIEESTLTAIGASIRDKTGKQDLISPLNMPTEIGSIKGGNIIKTVSGICPITLEDCVEGNLLDYKIYGAEGGVGDFNRLNHSGANAGYIEVEYIESNGTQYIDTGYIPTENTRVDLKWLSTDTKGAQAVVGCGWNGSAMLLNIQSNKWYFHGPGMGVIAPSLTDPDIISFGAAANSFVVNGVTYNNAKDTLENAKTNLKVFGLNGNDGFGARGRLYYLTIYEGDTLIHEYIPVIKEGTCGLWDNVTNEFITSSNTKAFTSGPTCYSVPIKVNNDVYNVNLVSPLNSDDYLDYENRCVVKSDGTKTHIDLLEIPLIEGTNTFDVETTVKPSNVSLTYVKGIEFNTMKTVEGILPLTVEGVGQKLEDYKVYGAAGETLYYGDNNEYVGYNYITTKQASGASNKAGFNSGIRWNQVNKIRFSIRNNTAQENNMIFAAKATNENVCSALTSPWIGIGQVKYPSQGLTMLTYENHPDPGTFGIDTLKFTTPTSANYIWVASWMDSAWSRNNDWGFIEFYKDDALVAAFYPAKRVSDGVFGFYNTVSGDFITCNADESAFVGDTELSTAVGELLGNYYVIPININGNITNINSPSRLGESDYIDFENRKLVVDGVQTHIDLPEIYLQNGQNVINVDTTVKPSKMSVSYVDPAEQEIEVVKALGLTIENGKLCVTYSEEV